MAKFIDWKLYDRGLKNGTVTVDDVMLATDCCRMSVHNHCRANGIKIKGQPIRRSRRGYGYLADIKAGIKRHGSLAKLKRYARAHEGEY